jgi:glycerol-1-phosphate dehydrogenase [NAD(P)+]
MKTADRLRLREVAQDAVAEIEWNSAFVCSMEEPWRLVSPLISDGPCGLHFVEHVTQEELDAVDVPEGCREIAGIGGGSAIDSAKYLGWKHGLSVTAVPTIASVDAMVTPSIAVRVAGIVHYIGNVAPTRVVVCHELMARAPAHLNRAGIADVLSIHTASHDWRLIHELGNGPYSSRIAAQARAVLKRVVDGAAEIRVVSASGVRLLVEAFSEINDMTLDWGSARMEEGSEHFFAYAHERLTARSYVHGELVGLGILLMSILQDNEPLRAKAALDEAGCAYAPADIGSSEEEVYSTLSALSEFVVQNRLWESVVDHARIDPGSILDAFRRLT